jgi:hypothetical protein
VIVERQGTLTPGQTLVEEFGLLGTGRRVQAAVEVVSAPGSPEPSRVRADIVCDGTVLGSAEGADGAPIALDLRNAGPGRCALTLTGVAGAAGYQATLTLSIEGVLP